VVTERVSALRMRYRLDRRNLPDIRFEVIEIINEHGGVRLALVR
jgi:predicted ester cyclase